MLDCRMGFDELSERGATIGSGAIVVMDREMQVWDMLNSILRFFEHESCGKCVPCRVGSKHLLRLMQDIRNTGTGKDTLTGMLVEQAGIMEKTSLCPLGMSHIMPVRTAVHYFPDLL
jgi:NADH:ubiquinone oxidoreductase subunit F (NADH-binding)